MLGMLHIAVSRILSMICAVEQTECHASQLTGLISPGGALGLVEEGDQTSLRRARMRPPLCKTLWHQRDRAAKSHSHHQINVQKRTGVPVAMGVGYNLPLFGGCGKVFSMGSRVVPTYRANA